MSECCVVHLAWFHLCVSAHICPPWADALEALQQEYSARAEKQCEEEAELVAESQHCLGVVDKQR